MKVLGIYGSPRKGGNTDLLLGEALEGATEAGALIDRLYPRDLSIRGCDECGGCDGTGRCVVGDDMQEVYPRLLAADAIILAVPVFFYGFPAQVKALVDRCQAAYMRRLIGRKAEDLERFESGTGHLLSVGATQGKRLFDGMRLTAKYFFWALDMACGEELLFKKIENKGDVKGHPEALAQARRFGGRIAGGKQG